MVMVVMVVMVVIVVMVVMVVVMVVMMNLEECMVGDQRQVADLPLPLLPCWASLPPLVNSLKVRML